MSVEITGRVVNADGVKLRIRLVGPNLKEWFNKWAFKWASKIERSAKSKLYWRTQGIDWAGGRFTGHLRRSIVARPVDEPGRIGYVVGPTVFYARFVEGYPQKTRRHFVPFIIAPSLLAWATRHGIHPKPTRGKYRWSPGGLMVGGKSWPFLQPAWRENIGPALGEMRKEFHAFPSQ